MAREPQMRVAILSESLATGGAEGQAVLSACELARCGHQVAIVTYHPGNHYEEVLREHGVEFHHVTASGALRIGRLRELVRYLRKFRPDVVHAFSGTSSIYAFLGGRKAKAPAVFGGFRAQLPVRTMIRWLGGRLSRAASGWITNCHCGKDSIVRQFGADPDKVFVVPNGVPPSRIESSLTRLEAREKFQLPPDHPVVSIVALLKPEKNHRMFLRMARRVIDSGLTATFVAAGDGILREQIPAWVEELGLAGHVRLLGRCDAVPDLLRATDVLVLTSDLEGLPNALIEAGGAGVPCVSTDCGGPRDILIEGRTGYLVPVDDDDAMARRVIELLADPDLRSRMGRASADRIAEEFSPAALAENLQAVYRQALGGSA